MFSNLPELDLSWTITVAIAITALISPIVVAIINNVHHTKIRKMELRNELEQKQFDVYYADKEQAYNKFITDAGKLLENMGYTDTYSNIYSSAHQVLLLCTEETKPLVLDFISYFNSTIRGGSKKPDNWKEIYQQKFCNLTVALNTELASTARSISQLYKPQITWRLLSHRLNKR